LIDCPVSVSGNVDFTNGGNDSTTTIVRPQVILNMIQH